MIRPSPPVSSVIGLKHLVIAPMLADDADGHSYDDVHRVTGAIEATITPENGDPDVLYADDGEYDSLFLDPKISFTTKLADIPLSVQQLILNHIIDSNGVLIRTARDKPPYFAAGFKSEKADGTYRYMWLYKCRAKPVTENYGTKSGDSVTRQTGEVSWTAVRRTHDKRYQAVADDGVNGFDDGDTFLDSVFDPTVTPYRARVGITAVGYSIVGGN